MTDTDTTTTLPLAPGHWTLDTTHASVHFVIRHLGLAKVRGRFTDFDASLVVGESPDDITVTATVALASIDTGNADRDAHVLSDEFLDVERNPTMTFHSTSVTGAGDDWQLAGDLTIAGVTRPVVWDVEFGGTGELMERLHAGFSVSGQISRKDHGIDFGVVNAALGDVVKFDLDLEFLAPE